MFRQRGVSLIAAIVVVVILAALAGFIASISVFQHSGNTLSLQNSRALAAARSGIEWGIWYVRNNNTCPSNPGASFTVGQFSVSMDSCSRDDVTEGISSYRIFRLEYSASSSGLSFGNPAYASRTLTATVLGP